MRAAPAAAMPARGASTWGVRCLCDGVPGRPPWEEVKAKDKAKVKAQAELLERLEREKSLEDKEIEREDAMEDQRHAVLDMARARENNWEMLERFLEEGKGPGQGEGPGQGDGGNMSSNEDGGQRPAAGYLDQMGRRRIRGGSA